MSYWEIQPDEAVWSYLDRLRRLLGYRYQQNFRTGQDGREDLGPLARFTGTSSGRLIHAHSTLPFTHSVDLPAPHEHTSGHQPLRPQAVMRPANSVAGFCVACWEEDLKWHGYVYWRRSHQLAGVFECLKHSTTLHTVSNRALSNRRPEELLGIDRSSADAAVASEWRRNEFVTHYVRLAHAILDLRAATTPKVFLKRLLPHLSEFATKGADALCSASAAELPVHPGRHGFRAIKREAGYDFDRLDNLLRAAEVSLIRRAPGTWLAYLSQFIPARRPDNGRILQLGLGTDAALYSGLSGPSRLITALLLIPTPDGALDLFVDGSLHWNASRTGPSRPAQSKASRYDLRSDILR